MSAAVAGWFGAAAGVGGVLLALVALLKVRPEAKRIKADTVKVITDAAAAIVVSVDSQMERMSAKVTALENRLEQYKDREDLQDHLLLVHERWDHAVTQQVRQLGGEVGDPPPLYPDPKAA